MSKVDSLAPSEKKYAPLMMKLNEFGFSDFARNRSLAIKHSGEINAVLGELYDEPEPVRPAQPPPQ